METVQGLDELDDFILRNHETNVIMIYFGANWCGPCKQLKERLHDPQTKKIMPQFNVCYLDVDDENNELLMKKYKVENLPTQIFIQLNGNKVVEVDRIVGYDFTRAKLIYDKLAQ